MTKAKRRANKWKTFATVLAVFLLVICFGLLYLTLSGSPAMEFIGRLLSPVEGSKSVRGRRVETKKPYMLTDKQKYYKDLVSEDSINVLIIGSDVSGANYDTLMIASLDDKNNTVKLINLPRDIYVSYSDDVIERLSKAYPKYKSSKGIYKINASHTIGKFIGYKKDAGRFKNPEYEFTADLIEEIFGIYIDDYVYLKPNSFVRVVDYFGGVDITVPYRMKYTDPTQNFKVDLKKGTQHLTGAQAEGFVRFRQGTDDNGKNISIGDIERKKNQNDFMKAFINQHMNLGNIGKIISIVSDLDEYLVSSVDKAKETAEYGKIAEKLYKNKFTLNSEDIECKDVMIDSVYYLELKVK